LGINKFSLKNGTYFVKNWFLAPEKLGDMQMALFAMRSCFTLVFSFLPARFQRMNFQSARSKLHRKKKSLKLKCDVTWYGLTLTFHHISNFNSHSHWICNYIIYTPRVLTFIMPHTTHGGIITSFLSACCMYRRWIAFWSWNRWMVGDEALLSEQIGLRTDRHTQADRQTSRP